MRPTTGRRSRLPLAAAVLLALLVLGVASVSLWAPAGPRAAVVSSPAVSAAAASASRVQRSPPVFSREPTRPGEVSVLSVAGLQDLLAAHGESLRGAALIIDADIEPFPGDILCLPNLVEPAEPSVARRPCPPGVITGTDPPITVQYGRFAPDPGSAPIPPVAVVVIDASSVEYVGAVAPGPAGLLWSISEVLASVAPQARSVVAARGWLVDTGDFTLACADPAPSASKAPSASSAPRRFHRCPLGPWLTPAENQPLTRLPAGWRLTQPSGGIRLQEDAYVRFADDPEKDARGLSMPRLGTYLLRPAAAVACVDAPCREWEMVGRLEPLGPSPGRLGEPPAGPTRPPVPATP